MHCQKTSNNVSNICLFHQELVKLWMKKKGGQVAGVNVKNLIPLIPINSFSRKDGGETNVEIDGAELPITRKNSHKTKNSMN